MSASDPFILVTVLVLLALMAVIFLLRRGQVHSRLTPLAGLAFACILAALVFSDDRWLGYGLIGLGVILAIVDMIQRRKAA